MLGDSDLEGVVFERKDDAFLLRYLRAKKFDQERALDLYTNYYRCRRDYPAIFEEFTPQSVERIFATGIISVLDHTALDGAKVRERGGEGKEREKGEGRRVT